MEANCPKCFNNSFKIVTGDDGKPISQCLKCGATTAFAPGASEAQPVTVTAGGKGAG